MRLSAWAIDLALCFVCCGVAYSKNTQVEANVGSSSLERGKYLAEIGACRACHTPPLVPDTIPHGNSGDVQTVREITLRSNPDWMQYLDSSRELAGGVPFIIRLSSSEHGVVYSRNITPDVQTGIGTWTEEQIIEALRTGKRPDGSNLFLFAPHTFYKNLAQEDLRALAKYLKAQPAVSHKVEMRDLPFPVEAVAAPSPPVHAPGDRAPARGKYLLNALVGCEECHSSKLADGKVHAFVGGDPHDPSAGVFRLGPDLPLRQTERGFAAFPFPGYAVLYSGNLTRFGMNGDKHKIALDEIIRAIRDGVATDKDEYGRPDLISPVMLWHFYKAMHYQDAAAIAKYIRALKYEPHDIGTRLLYFGERWDLAFDQVYGEVPSSEDMKSLGKSEHQGAENGRQ